MERHVRCGYAFFDFFAGDGCSRLWAEKQAQCMARCLPAACQMVLAIMSGGMMSIVGRTACPTNEVQEGGAVLS